MSAPPASPLRTPTPALNQVMNTSPRLVRKRKRSAAETTDSNASVPVADDASAVPVVGSVTGAIQADGADDQEEVKERPRKRAKRTVAAVVPEADVTPVVEATSAAVASDGRSSPKKKASHKKSHKKESKRHASAPAPESQAEEDKVDETKSDGDNVADGDAEMEEESESKQAARKPKKSKKVAAKKSHKKASRHMPAPAEDNDEDGEYSVENIEDDDERSKVMTLFKVMGKKNEKQSKLKDASEKAKQSRDRVLQFVMSNYTEDQEKCQKAAVKLAKAMARAADRRKQKKLDDEKERLRNSALGLETEAKKGGKKKGEKQKPLVTQEMKDACVLYKKVFDGMQTLVRCKTGTPHKVDQTNVGIYLRRKFIVEGFRIKEPEDALEVARDMFSASGRVNQATDFKVEYKKVPEKKKGRAKRGDDDDE
jgi:hypothetical protein